MTHTSPNTGYAPETPIRGVLWMCAAMVCFTILDAQAKLLVTGGYDALQVSWARYAFHVLPMVLILNVRFLAILKTGHPGLQIGRSILVLLVTVFYIIGLQTVPLADFAALLALTPVLVTVLSIPILKEKVGPRRWVGVFVAFAGAVIVLRPGMGVMDTAALIVLAGAITNAFFNVTTRFVSRTDSTMTSLAYSAVVGLVVLSLVLPFVWTTPASAQDWALHIGVGVFGALAHLFVIQAYTAANAATVAPFTYTNLIWATVWGYLLFGHLPDAWTITGAGTIVAGGLYVLHRARLRSKPVVTGP